MRAVLPRTVAGQISSSIVNGTVGRDIPVQDDIPASQWNDGVTRVLNSQRDYLLMAARDTAEAEAFRWQSAFVARLEAAVTAALGEQGLLYATGLVKAVRSTPEGLGLYLMTYQARIPSNKKQGSDKTSYS